MKKIFDKNWAFENICRWWLTGLLLFLPFQYRIVESLKTWSPLLATVLKRIDEITILIILPFVIVRSVVKGNVKMTYVLLIVPIIIFGISGIISGMLNGNSILTTAKGSLFYIKYFLPVFIYAHFFRSFADVKRTLEYLLLLGAFLGIIAFIQEIWALGLRYILKKDIFDTAIYLFRGLEIEHAQSSAFDVWWRFGLYRTSSLMGHYNIFGLYSLLLLTVYLFTVKRIKLTLFFALLAGIFVSVSRSIYAGFAVMAGFQVFRGRHWLIFLLIPTLIFMLKMVSLPDLDMSTAILSTTKLDDGLSENVNESSPRDSDFFRSVARQKAMTVWKDYPILGVGPGMFGSPIAVKDSSFVHEEYNFTSHTIGLIAGSIDQYWLQMLAETGILGVGTFAGFLFSLIIYFLTANKKVVIYESRGLFISLGIFIGILIIWGFGANINMVEIIFTYSALAGMALGYRENNNIYESELNPSSSAIV